jgi:hypothetical protein
MRRINTAVGLCWAAAAAAAAAAAPDCRASDAAVTAARDAVCASLVPASTPWCGYPDGTRSAGDWPSQSVYMNAALAALAAAPAGCLATPAASGVLSWLDASQATAALNGSFAWTWQVFQPQYFEMPRAAGERVEAPDTLGRKCWAYAYMTQVASRSLAALRGALAAAGLPAALLAAFEGSFSAAAPPAMASCDAVIANCFKNTSYQPALHNGTCAGDVALFGLGFQRENLLRGGVVAYPFWS